jgi:hypothetical protein
MEVNVLGKAKHINHRQLKKLAKFFGKQLLTDQSYSEIIVDIDLVPGLRKKKNRWGDADFWDRRHCPRLFNIRLDNHLGPRQIKRVLAHELAHVRQWAHGQMYDFKDGRVRWKNTIHSAYWSKWKRPHLLPWEKDAIKTERQLMQLWDNQ